MKKIIIFVFLFLFISFIHSEENFKIDWVNGKIYSFSLMKTKGDNNFATNRLDIIDKANEESKTGFYKALQKINFYESRSVLDYFEENPEKNRELHTFIDNAKLFKMEYPDLNSIKLTYSLNIFGDDSLMNIIIKDRNSGTEELNSYLNSPFKADYTGIIIDARGELLTFGGFMIKAKPSLFISIKDDEGNIIIDQNNIFSDSVKLKGMVRYSYNINEDVSARVGKNPLRIVASGAGDKSGNILVINKINAKKILSSEITKNAIRNGNIVIIINQ